MPLVNTDRLVSSRRYLMGMEIATDALADQGDHPDRPFADPYGGSLAHSHTPPPSTRPWRWRSRYTVELDDVASALDAHDDRNVDHV